MANLGTAASAARVFAALALAGSPTADLFGSQTSLRAQQVFEPDIMALGARTSRKSLSTSPSVIETGDESVPVVRHGRQTTPTEHVIGELRRWSLLTADWDGEGALAPIQSSVKAAISFACLLSGRNDIEPMLHASSGRAGLYLKNNSLYADIEFYGDSRVAYYIERNGGKHKGVVNFDKKAMPPVFDALLKV